MTGWQQVADVSLPLIAVAGLACAIAEPCGIAGTTVILGGGGEEESQALAAATTASNAAPNFSCEQTLVSHFTDHVMDQGEFGGFGYNTADEYLKGAQNLVSGGPDVQSLTRASDGAQLFYRASTNEFAVLHADGSIGTYFQPDDGAAYWARQVARG